MSHQRNDESPEMLDPKKALMESIRKKILETFVVGDQVGSWDGGEDSGNVSFEFEMTEAEEEHLYLAVMGAIDCYGFAGEFATYGDITLCQRGDDNEDEDEAEELAVDGIEVGDYYLLCNGTDESHCDYETESGDEIVMELSAADLAAWEGLDLPGTIGDRDDIDLENTPRFTHLRVKNGPVSDNLVAAANKIEGFVRSAVNGVSCSLTSFDFNINPNDDDGTALLQVEVAYQNYKQTDVSGRIEL